MPSKLPVLKRCCFCIPLRPGLLAWGYLKLAVAVFFLIYSLYGLHQIVSLYIIHEIQSLMNYIIMLVVMVLLVIIDITLHVIFIIGGHKKHIHFFKIYNYYSMSLLVLTFILGLISAGLTITSMVAEYTEKLLLFLISDFSSLVFNLLIQGYVIILVRSEIVKLQNRNSFRFVNIAADAECTLNIEDVNDQSEEKEKYIQNQDYSTME